MCIVIFLIAILANSLGWILFCKFVLIFSKIAIYRGREVINLIGRGKISYLPIFSILMTLLILTIVIFLFSSLFVGLSIILRGLNLWFLRLLWVFDLEIFHLILLGLGFGGSRVSKAAITKAIIVNIINIKARPKSSLRFCVIDLLHKCFNAIKLLAVFVYLGSYGRL